MIFRGRDIQVLLTGEGIYPLAHGGVSTWCDLLVRHVQGVRFTVMTVMANPYLPARYPVPPAVERWLKVPLWGTEDPYEHTDVPLADSYLRQKRTTPAVVRERLLPVLSKVIEAFWTSGELDAKRLVGNLVELYKLFSEYDYALLMKDEAVWTWYSDLINRQVAPRLGLTPSISDLIQSLGWVYRFLTVLVTPVPKVDVIHSSAAAFCALPGVIGRTLYGIPFLLTEHGVYLREQYQNVGRSALSPFLKRALLGITRAVTASAYAAADVVAPVAAFNTRWEQVAQVPSQKIRVVYNGIDPKIFRPRPRPEASPPTVVAVARIDPVKDLATLLRAARLVKDERPDVNFVVYGAVAVRSYYRHLQALRHELNLDADFRFAGHAADTPSAYASADVIVLSSLSEGFPYAVVEAMMCERPVVATDVGGVREALGHSGLLVPATDHAAMAKAIVRVLAEPALARSMAADGRQRALANFTVQGFVERYEALYRALATPTAVKSRERIRLTIARARGLAAAGFADQAVELMRQLLRQESGSQRLQAMILLELSRVQVQAGRVEEARLSLEKARLLRQLGTAQSA